MCASAYIPKRREQCFQIIGAASILQQKYHSIKGVGGIVVLEGVKQQVIQLGKVIGQIGVYFFGNVRVLFYFLNDPIGCAV